MSPVQGYVIRKRGARPGAVPSVKLPVILGAKTWPAFSMQASEAAPGLVLGKVWESVSSGTLVLGTMHYPELAGLQLPW